MICSFNLNFENPSGAGVLRCGLTSKAVRVIYSAMIPGGVLRNYVELKKYKSKPGRKTEKTTFQRASTPMGSQDGGNGGLRVHFCVITMMYECLNEKYIEKICTFNDRGLFP